MAKYLVNGPHILENELKRIDKDVEEPNRSYLKSYQDFLALNSKKERTQYKRLSELRAICGLQACKDFRKLTKKDAEEIVRRVNKLKVRTAEGKTLNQDLNAYSKARTKLTFKQFVTWLDPKTAPESVGWIKLDRSATSEKLPEEMLTEEDVQKLLDACKGNIRNRALISLIWDSGARIGEILNLKVKDLTLSSSGPSRVVLTGKTGTRVTPLADSVPALAIYLNSLRRGAKPADPLFTTLQNGLPTDNALDYPDVKKLLGELKARSGVIKRVHAHVFRYSRCTYLVAHGMSANALMRHFGWKSTKMVEHYGKLSTAQVEEDFYRATGLNHGHEPDKPKLISTCWKCHASAEAGAVYCVNCGSALDKTQFEKLDEHERMAKELAEIKEYLEELDKKFPEIRKIVKSQSNLTRGAY